jgi:hypothetical protein
MWAKRAAQILALFGLYSLVLAAIGGRLATQGKADFAGSMVEFLIVTVVFAAGALFIFTRPTREPLE